LTVSVRTVDIPRRRFTPFDANTPIGGPMKTLLPYRRIFALIAGSLCDPLTGEEVEKIVAGLFKLEPALVAKMADVLK
jgi:hypothetical protein